jgi:hypothetical protein
MSDRFFVIFGTQSKAGDRKSVRPVRSRRDEPDLGILRQSPCLQCELYLEKTLCPFVKACSKIDEFQRVAAVHCTLYKDRDVFSILKI